MHGTELTTQRQDSFHPTAAPWIQVRAASDDGDWCAARAIITEHIAWMSASLGIDYSEEAQPSVRGELAGLERFYTPPRGRLLLAWKDGIPVGTVGVITPPDGIAELKRLYVRPSARGHNLGESLVRAALRTAAEFDCHTIRLSTLPPLMDAAIAIYRRCGFHETEPFGDVDLEGLLYLVRSVPPLVDSSAA